MICIASVPGFLSLGFIAFGVMLCLEIDTPGDTRYYRTRMNCDFQMLFFLPPCASSNSSVLYN
jgi:hypothetical protein